jgi:hypothetical protein
MPKAGGTSAASGGALVLVLVDMEVLLLHGWAGLEGRPQGAGPECGATREARLLSSYNNNSNNPRRGTDRLHGAW